MTNFTTPDSRNPVFVAAETTSNSWKAYTEFVEEFRAESDRAAVILGAAKLDQVMYQILQKVLLPTPEGDDELLDGDTPLSTFSAKIKLLYRLGVIDAGFARALNLTRKIRNSFAHEISGCRLDSGAHRDRVKELVSPFAGMKFYRQFQAHYFGTATGPAVEFRTILALMVGRLESIHSEATRVAITVRSSLSLDTWATGIPEGDRKPAAPA